MILDIHTHKPLPQPEAVADISALIAEATGVHSLPDGNGGVFSVGIHPWTTLSPPSEELWKRIEEVAADERVKAIGECGIDLVKGGPMFRQLEVMKRMVDISENLQKPMIIHDVKAHDIIIGLRRDLKPRQNWVIHGFRGKPQLAASLINAGCRVSFGEHFNADTLRTINRDEILAETDESELTIEEIIGRLSEIRGEDVTESVRENTASFLL